MSHDGYQALQQRRRADHEKWLREGHLVLDELIGPQRSKVRACRSGFDRRLCKVNHECEGCKYKPDD